ncbi:hypothetical protein [Actinomadura graeca]|nr:hypothetical protein [Actinomadura graeca]
MEAWIARLPVAALLGIAELLTAGRLTLGGNPRRRADTFRV